MRSPLCRFISLFALVFAALLAAGTPAAHAQAAPVLTGVMNSSNGCDPLPSPIRLGGDQAGSSLTLICGNNFDANTTISFGTQPGALFYSVYQGVSLILFQDTTGYVSGPHTVNLIFCNGTACTTYVNGWTWYTGAAIPYSVSPTQINAQVQGIAAVHGIYMGAAGGATICGENAPPDPQGFGQTYDTVLITWPYYVGGPTVCDLTITSYNGEQQTLSNAFTYINTPTPNPTGLAPTNGPVVGGTNILITGTYFGAGDTVTIGGIPATNVVINNHTSLTATVPASLTGAHAADVSVTGPNGTGTMPNGFSYGTSSSVFLADPSSGLGALTSDGSLLSAATSGGGTGLAVDQSGYVWSLDGSGSGVSRFTRAGVLANDYTSLSLLSTPTALATDGAGLIWIANSGTPSITAVTSTGAALGTSSLATTTIGAAPSAIAIDQAGGIWIASKTGNKVTHIIGTATPVVTPIASGVANSNVGKKP